MILHEQRHRHTDNLQFAKVWTKDIQLSLVTQTQNFVTLAL